MWDYIFTYRTVLPDGLGWSHWGVIHLSYLAMFTIATIVMYRLYKQGDEVFRTRVKVFYAAMVAILEGVKVTLCIYLGVWEPGLLPFHLCGMTIGFVIIHTFYPNKTTAELLYSLGLPGATAALLFADWNMYPVANFFLQQSFFIHFFLVSYTIMLIGSGEIRPRFTNLWRSVVFLLVVVPPIYVFNKIYDTNFFFINGAAANSPLSFLQNFMGDPGYIFGAAILLFIVWLAMYTPWIIKSKKEHSAL